MQIDQDAVNAAADAIVVTGKKPTQSAVRDRLNGGSYTTIGPLLRAWAEARRQASEDAAVALAQTVSRVMDELAGRVWRVASEEAGAAVTAARRETAELREQVEAEGADHLDVVARLETERDTAQEEARDAEGRLSVAASEIIRLEERVAAREREVAQAMAREEAMRAELAALRERMETIAVDLARAQSSLHDPATAKLSGSNRTGGMRSAG